MFEEKLYSLSEELFDIELVESDLVFLLFFFDIALIALSTRLFTLLEVTVTMLTVFLFLDWLLDLLFSY